MDRDRLRARNPLSYALNLGYGSKGEIDVYPS